MRKTKTNIKNPLIFQLSIFILSMIFFFSFYIIFDLKDNNIERETQLIYQKLDYNSQMVQLFIEEKGNYLKPLKSIFETTEILDLLSDSTDNKYLKTINDDKFVSNPYIGLADGRFLSGTDWVPGEGYDPRTRVWYQDALSSESITFTRPYIDLMSYDYTISAVVPLNINGKFTGVLGEDIYLNGLSDFIKALNLPGDGTPFISTEDGLVIGHSNKNYIASNSHDIAGYKSLMFLVDKGEYIFETDFNGTDSIVFVSNIPVLKSKFIYIVDRDFIYKPIDSMVIKYTFLLFVLAVLIIVVLLKTTVVVTRVDAEIDQITDTESVAYTGKSSQRSCSKKDVEFRVIERLKNTIAYVNDLRVVSSKKDDNGVASLDLIRNDLNEIALNMIEIMDVSEERSIKSKYEIFKMNDVFRDLTKYYEFRNQGEKVKLNISRFEVSDTEFIGNRILVKDILICVVNRIFGLYKDVSIEMLSEYDGYFYTIALFVKDVDLEKGLDLSVVENVIIDVGGNFIKDKGKVQISFPMYLYNESRQSIESFENMYDMAQMKGRLIYDENIPGIGAILDIVKSKDISIHRLNERNISVGLGDIVFVNSQTTDELLDGLNNSFVVYILNKDRGTVELDDMVKDVIVRPITAEKIYDKIRNRNRVYDKN